MQGRGKGQPKSVSALVRTRAFRRWINVHAASGALARGKTSDRHSVRTDPRAVTPHIPRGGPTVEGQRVRPISARPRLRCAISPQVPDRSGFHPSEPDDIDRLAPSAKRDREINVPKSNIRMIRGDSSAMQLACGGGTRPQRTCRLRPRPGVGHPASVQGRRRPSGPHRQ
jgi:hypothetical protein